MVEPHWLALRGDGWELTSWNLSDSRWQLDVVDDRITDARLAFAGAADVPVRCGEAEEILIGQQPAADLFAEAAQQAIAGLTPPADLHGSSDYRKKVAATLVRRGLQAAADDAQRRR